MQNFFSNLPLACLVVLTLTAIIIFFIILGTKASI